MKAKEFCKGYIVLDLSTEYLHLVKNVVEENIKGGNLWMYFGDNLANGEYEEKTKWSDFNISNPIFFNFYHGLELLLKRFLLLRENYVLEANHKFKKLFKDFQENYSERTELISILNKYLAIESMPQFIAECLRENNVQINDLYEFFRYPFDKKFQKQHDYSRVRYKEEDGLIFFNNFVNDVNLLLTEAVKLYREIETKKT